MSDFGLGSINITVDKEYITRFQLWDFTGEKKYSDLVMQMCIGLQTAILSLMCLI